MSGSLFSLLLCITLWMAPPLSAPSTESVLSAPEPPVEIRLVAAGDNLIHDVIYWQAKREDGYDFSRLYDRVGRYIRESDIAFVNQETPLVPDRPPSSYPMFNTPIGMSGNLRSTGFDVLNIANNHMLDMGADGLAKTMETIRSTEGLTLTGAYFDHAGRDTIPIVKANGARLAFLGFTQHTNGILPPADRAGMIVYTQELDEIERLLTLARSQADAVVVSVHWGEEGSLVPSAGQKELARQLADLGADLIIGTHPHVLQPAEYLDRADGGRTLVLYSLGNFVSAQVDPANLVSAVADISLLYDASTRTCTVTGHSFIPIVTHYEASFQSLSIYPLDEYTAELAARHGVRLRGKAFNLDVIDRILEKTIGLENQAHP